MKPFTVAIYSGEIPAPSFIERLLRGLSAKGNQKIVLFGYIKSKTYRSNDTVTVVGYSGLVSKMYTLLKYSILLFLLRRAEKKVLDDFLKTQPGSKYMLKVRAYPVLWHKPDIFHLQWAKGVLFWHWVQLFGIKLIVSLRGAHINYTPIINPAVATGYRKLFPHVDAFHAVSQTIKIEAEKYAASAEKIKVIYSILPNHFAKHFVPHENPKRTPLKILSIGRFHWKKGYGYALEAIHQLKKAGIFVEYTIVAGVAIPEEILFTVDQLGIQDQVKFIARIEPDKIPIEMQKYSLMLLPSIEEGIANVVLEAMAVGLPVISTNAGGMHEVIVNNKTGWLVSATDPEAMKNAIMMYLTASEELLINIRQQAYNWVFENNSERIQVEKFLKLYHEVLINKN